MRNFKKFIQPLATLFICSEMCSNNVNSIIFNAISVSILKSPPHHKKEGERELKNEPNGWILRTNMQSNIYRHERSHGDSYYGLWEKKIHNDHQFLSFLNKFVRRMMNCLLVIVKLWEKLLFIAICSGILINWKDVEGHLQHCYIESRWRLIKPWNLLKHFISSVSIHLSSRIEIELIILT